MSSCHFSSERFKRFRSHHDRHQHFGNSPGDRPHWPQPCRALHHRRGCLTSSPPATRSKTTASRSPCDPSKKERRPRAPSGGSWTEQIPWEKLFSNSPFRFYAVGKFRFRCPEQDTEARPMGVQGDGRAVGARCAEYAEIVLRRQNRRRETDVPPPDTVSLPPVARLLAVRSKISRKPDFLVPRRDHREEGLIRPGHGRVGAPALAQIFPKRTFVPVPPHADRFDHVLASAAPCTPPRRPRSDSGLEFRPWRIRKHVEAFTAIVGKVVWATLSRRQARQDRPPVRGSRRGQLLGRSPNSGRWLVHGVRSPRSSASAAGTGSNADNLPNDAAGDIPAACRQRCAACPGSACRSPVPGCCRVGSVSWSWFAPECRIHKVYTTMPATASRVCGRGHAKSAPTWPCCGPAHDGNKW